MEIALYRPEIPQNTGNIGRVAFCTGSRLHIIGEPSFSMSDAAVRRAGLDYWKELDLVLHEDWKKFIEYFSIAPGENSQRSLLLYSKFGEKRYCDHKYQSDDILVFGRESSGMPEEILESARRDNPGSILRIPVRENCRSLNLSNAVSIVLFEALRQLDFPNLSGTPFTGAL